MDDLPFVDITELIEYYEKWKEVDKITLNQCETFENTCKVKIAELASSSKENKILLDDIAQLRILVKKQQENISKLFYLQDENKTLVNTIKSNEEELQNKEKEIAKIKIQHVEDRQMLKNLHQVDIVSIEEKCEQKRLEETETRDKLIKEKENEIESLRKELMAVKVQFEEDMLKIEVENKKSLMGLKERERKLLDANPDNHLRKTKEIFINKLRNLKSEHENDVKKYKEEIERLKEKMNYAKPPSEIEILQNQQIQEEVKIEPQVTKAKTKAKPFIYPKVIPRANNQFCKPVLQFTRKRKLFQPDGNFM